MTDLFSHNVDVVRAKDLLERLEEESRKETNHYGQQSTCPESQLAIDLWRSVVELEGTCCGCPHACPEPDEQDRESSKAEHNTVPTVRVHENVDIDYNDDWMRNVNAHLVAAVDVDALFAFKRGHIEQEIGHEEADDGLVQTVEHVEPAYSQHTSFELECSSKYQNFGCVHSFRSMPVRYSWGTASETLSLTSWSRAPSTITAKDVKARL